ncbi:DUF2335 domain-containing protein [Aliarcobacter butzleri]|uniref:DUF2335 domain-containing protein n=1 Tax=Aliarcobacter butzleri TaxID=28197 RepID=UPI00263D1D71|nr:DUF2335 domain-containing protein [Aliarcobacter butzleri]MDN5077627.1 DUF2335 domain-containing protein [Aliarcobacter butzleri]MDN5118825.1 DUF2335 domain-containing protein [Aliarcobacter butzleri]MDS1315791.1 DUF2335 domain-containing protein [Aliarcobacter butzleri]
MNKENVLTKTIEQESANQELLQAEEIIKAEIGRLEQIIIKREESFSGPLPHPEHFKKYNQIVPGSANRLLKMAEDDLAHAHSMQRKQLNIELFAVVAGLIVGATIALVALIGSGYLIMQGHDIAGAILGGGSLASLVGVFIYGRNLQNSSK